MEQDPHRGMERLPSCLPVSQVERLVPFIYSPQHLTYSIRNKLFRFWNVQNLTEEAKSNLITNL